MLTKYRQAIKVGILGGILLIALHILDILVVLSIAGIISNIDVGLGKHLESIIFTLSIVVLFFIGMLAIRATNISPGDSREVIKIVLGVGLTTGIIASAFGILAGFFEPQILCSREPVSIMSGGLALNVLWFSFGNISIVLCAPLRLIIYVIIIIIGGLFYSSNHRS